MRYEYSMRLVFILALLAAAPLYAWEFSATSYCTMTQMTEETRVRVTCDARVPEYAISITRIADSWPKALLFVLRFDGPRGREISTTKHQLSQDGATLTVTDTGFSNVLDGLEFNDTATALMGTSRISVPLSGAPKAVRAFRACTEAGLV